MSQRRRIGVDQVRQELTCPQCDYSLQGLAGDLVTCPECGTTCDLPKLILRWGFRPWYRAPGFSRILRPLAWPGIGFWFILFVLAVEQSSVAHPPIWTSGLAIVVFAAWLRAMWRVWKVLPGGRALWLSLLAHATLAGYLAAVVASFWLVGTLLRGGAQRAMVLLVWVLPIIGLAYACRRGEKFIAQQCIRQYLLEATAPGTMSSP